MSRKNCDFSNFCDFSKNCEKLEKSQFLLKYNMTKNSEKSQFSQFSPLRAFLDISGLGQSTYCFDLNPFY